MFEVGKCYKFISSDIPLSTKEDLSEDNDFFRGKKVFGKENSIFLLLDSGKSKKNPTKYYPTMFYVKIVYEGKIYYLHYVVDSLFYNNPENYIICLK